MSERPPRPGAPMQPAAEPPDDEPPPLLGRWWRLYALVIVELVAMIALCAWLSRRP